MSVARAGHQCWPGSAPSCAAACLSSNASDALKHARAGNVHPAMHAAPLPGPSSYPSFLPPPSASAAPAAARDSLTAATSMWDSTYGAAKGPSTTAPASAASTSPEKHQDIMKQACYLLFLGPAKKIRQDPQAPSITRPECSTASKTFPGQRMTVLLNAALRPAAPQPVP